jgi:hypothetical protein
MSEFLPARRIRTVSEQNYFSYVSGNHQLLHWQEFVQQAEPTLESIEAKLLECDSNLSVVQAAIPGLYRVQWVTPKSYGEEEIIIGSFEL